MGNLHDLSGYDRTSMVVEFTELAKQGMQTPEPLWMSVRGKPAEWAQQTRHEWREYGHSDDQFRGKPDLRRAAMLKALEEQEIPKKKPAPKPDAEKPAADESDAGAEKSKDEESAG